MLHCCHRKIKPRPRVACIENLVNFRRVACEMCELIDNKLTNRHRHIDKLIAIFLTLTGRSRLINSLSGQRFRIFRPTQSMGGTSKTSLQQSRKKENYFQQKFNVADDCYLEFKTSWYLHDGSRYRNNILHGDARTGTEDNKNSSGDEIANVNFLRRYGTYVLQNTKTKTKITPDGA